MTSVFADPYVSYGYVFKRNPHWHVLLVRQPCEEHAN